MSKSWYRLAEILLPNELNSAIESNKKISKPQTVNTIAPKSKPVKYVSIGKTQMAMGRSGTVVTSGGLLTNNKTTIKKKKLLGE
jgi:hypothetical protein